MAKSVESSLRILNDVTASWGHGSPVELDKDSTGYRVQVNGHFITQRLGRAETIRFLNSAGHLLGHLLNK
jgi:hypothetical protein